jgi:hypothetical protein
MYPVYEARRMLREHDASQMLRIESAGEQIPREQVNAKTAAAAPTLLQPQCCCFPALLLSGYLLSCRSDVAPCRSDIALHGAISLLHGATSLLHGATSLLHGATSLLHGAASLLHGATSLQHGAASLLHGAGCTALGATSLHAVAQRYEQARVKGNGGAGAPLRRIARIARIARESE